MRSTVTIVTPPATEPVSIDLLRSHLRVDTANDDLLLANYLRAARTMAELYLSRALVTQTLLWTMQPVNPVWPRNHGLWWTLELPRMPVQSVSSVVTLDRQGYSTTIAAAVLPVVYPNYFTGYIADLAQEPARLRISPRTILANMRELCETNLEYVQVTFVAGYAPSGPAIPQPIIDAILMTAANLYEHRGDEADVPMPRAIEWLLDPYRMMWSP
jgi:uncharacterized phiE125 gp8 family phage protein